MYHNDWCATLRSPNDRFALNDHRCEWGVIVLHVHETATTDATVARQIISSCTILSCVHPAFSIRVVNYNFHWKFISCQNYDYTCFCTICSPRSTMLTSFVQTNANRIWIIVFFSWLFFHFVVSAIILCRPSIFFLHSFKSERIYLAKFSDFCLRLKKTATQAKKKCRFLDEISTHFGLHSPIVSGQRSDFKHIEIDVNA